MSAATRDPQREAVRRMQLRDWHGALEHLERALADNTNVPQTLLAKAQCLLALGRRAAAREAAAQALAFASDDAALQDALGSFFSFAGDQTQALAAFERAVTLAPDNAHFIFNRATVRRFSGDLAGAEADYDRAIALRPADFEAYKNRSELRTQTAGSNHVAELERLAARGFADWRGEVQVRYTLAKEYEDLGEYAKSFEQLQSGAARRRANLQYDVANDVDTVQWIVDAFPAEPLPASPPVQAAPWQAAPWQAAPMRAAPLQAAPVRAAPIFIVGLPRSGTTVVDRILGSHSEVTSAGELNDFALALVARVRTEHGGVQLPRKDLVARAAHIDFAALGQDYLARARAGAGSGRFTDKMPLNYLYCGLIRRALPHARIVHLTRHPMAAGYAMYKTLFKDGYPFSYDLGEIARYYAAYRRLMAHWCHALPGAIHTVSYESLVADQLGESHRLLEFCGLEWQDACANFHLNPAATTTASAAQVRRPMYGTSVAQWRHYEKELAPLRAALEAAGIDPYP